MASNAPGGRQGRWVFQSMRWHYVPAGRDPGSDRSPSEPEPALSSLVDIRRLTGALTRWTTLSGLPALAFLVGPGSDLHLVHPRDLDSQPDGHSPFLCWLDGQEVQDRMEEAAARCAAGGGSIAAPEEGGHLLTIPVLPGGAGGSRVRAVVVALVPDVPGLTLRCSVRGGEALRRGLYPAQTPATWPGVRAVLQELLRAAAEDYGAWLGQVLELRSELAAARGRNRELMVRVEAVERRLLESCSEPVIHLDDAGTVLEDRILAQLLDLPGLGITVERCEDHRILYLNPNLRRRFGDRVGEPCYRVFRDRETPCPPSDCPMEQLFRPDAPETVSHIASDPGSGLYYEVFSIPLIGRDGSRQILEVGVDVTRFVQRGGASGDPEATRPAGEASDEK